MLARFDDCWHCRGKRGRKSPEISPHAVIGKSKSQGSSQFLSYVTISSPIDNTK